MWLCDSGCHPAVTLWLPGNSPDDPPDPDVWNKCVLKSNEWIRLVQTNVWRLRERLFAFRQYFSFHSFFITSELQRRMRRERGATFSHQDKADAMQNSSRMFWFHCHGVITALWEDIKPPAVPQSTRKNSRTSEVDWFNAETFFIETFSFWCCCCSRPLVWTELLELLLRLYACVPDVPLKRDKHWLVDAHRDPPS